MSTLWFYTLVGYILEPLLEQRCIDHCRITSSGCADQQPDTTRRGIMEIGALRLVLQACNSVPGDSDDWLLDDAIARQTRLQLSEVRNCIESLDDRGLVRSARLTDGLKVQITAEGRLFLSQRRRFPEEIRGNEAEKGSAQTPGSGSPAGKRKAKPPALIRTKKDGPSCFVIGPFTKEFDECYREVIRPAIKDAGLVPLRADEINKPGVIVNQIWDGINAAAICLAELSSGFALLRETT